jgi:hypothetical protein
MSKSPKAGYYIENVANDAFIYLYLKEENQWVFLSSDSSDEESGFPVYDSEYLLTNCKYVGKHLNDLVKHVVNSKLAK